MPKFLSQNETFLNCKKEGKFIVTSEIDIEKIKSMLKIAEGDVTAANFLKNLPKENKQWNSIYKLYYDALHELVEAFLRFEKIKSDNHQCLFSYICEKHPEFDFDWNFFEKIRTKRNGINYYGTPINYEDWKETELQFILYIKKLQEELNKKIENHEKQNK